MYDIAILSEATWIEHADTNHHVTMSHVRYGALQWKVDPHCALALLGEVPPWGVMLRVCVYPALLRYATTANARHRRLEPVREVKGGRGEPAEAIRRKEHAKAEEVERRVPNREVMPGYV